MVDGRHRQTNNRPKSLYLSCRLTILMIYTIYDVFRNSVHDVPLWGRVDTVNHLGQTPKPCFG